VALKTPLVLGTSGHPEQLQPGDSLSGAASGLAGVATITPPNTNGGVYEWGETVAAAGVTAASKILLSLAATVDSDENDPEFLNIASMQGTARTGQITFNLTFNEPTSGPILINWSAQ
jgi:hypothetical protein